MAPGKKEDKSSSKVNTLLVLLVLLYGGFSAYKHFYSGKETVSSSLNIKTKTNEDIPGKDSKEPIHISNLKFLVGYINDIQKEEELRMLNEASPIFKQAGLVFNIDLKKPDPLQMVESGEKEKIDWDLAKMSSSNALQKYLNGQNVEPILWQKNCNLRTEVMVKKQSNINTIEDLKNKKILLTSISATSYQDVFAIKKLGLEIGSIYYNYNRAIARDYLDSGKVDALMSEVYVFNDGTIVSPFYGKTFNPASDYKRLTIVEFFSPCKVILARKDLSQETKDKIKDIYAKNSKSGMSFFANYEKIESKDFDSLEMAMPHADFISMKSQLKPIAELETK